MASKNLLAALDSSVMTLTGGTQISAAVMVEGWRQAEDADVRVALAAARAQAAEGPFRDWLLGCASL